MSVRVMTAVWEHSPQKEGSLLILLALADFAHDDGGGAFPSIKTLAHKARMSERNAQYCLRRLEAAGEIEKQGFHTSGATIWRVVLPLQGGANIAGANIAPGAIDDTIGVQVMHRGGATSCTLTVNEPSVLEPSVPPPISPPKSKSRKARMTNDWEPSPKLRAYAVEWGIPEHYVDEMAREFREYWLDRPRDVRNWDLTFQNRVRDVAPQYAKRAQRTNGRDINANILQPGLVPDLDPHERERLNRIREAALAKEREQEGTAHERWQRKQHDQARSAIPRS